MAVELNVLHWLYLFIVFIVVAVMVMRRDTLIPCIIGLFLFGLVARGSFIAAVQVIYNALVTSGGVFWEIIVIISLVVAMSKAMADVGADILVMRPVAKLMKSPTVAFWTLGLSMLIITWFIWPTPAVALIGSIMLPVAVRAGLPIMGAAMAMNIFGHGLGLSTDFIIQGAPKISGEAAGIGTTAVVSASVPLFITMAVVTTVTAYLLVMKNIRDNKAEHEAERNRFAEEEAKAAAKEFDFSSYLIAALVPIAFTGVIVSLLVFDLKGGEATALVGGTAVIITVISAISQHGTSALEKFTDYIRDGFMFGIKVFAPVVILGAFFFLGDGELLPQIVGGEPLYPVSDKGILGDFGIWLSNQVPLNRVMVAILELIVGMMVGLDGSGFAPLPLTGSLARTFGLAADVDIATLAALGQFGGVWVGGGTIVPWGLIPVAAICGIEPFDLARHNFFPVMLGLAVTTIVAIFIM